MSITIGDGTKRNLGLRILRAGAMELRRVPQLVTNDEVETLPKEQQPFLYASGNWGLGYVSVKNLVGRTTLIVSLVKYLAFVVADWAGQVDFIAGNVTGGVVPGWLLAQELSGLLGRVIPFVYIRDLRKKGGQKELITGIANNPEIPLGSAGVVVEELVNFAETICNGAICLREAGYVAKEGACILSYRNPVAEKALKENSIEMSWLLSLQDLLDSADENKTHPADLLAEYKRFLLDPLAWQAERGLTHVEKGGTK